MNVKFIDYSRDYKRFQTEYDEVWHRINETGQLILRADTEEFEQRLAEYVGTKFAVALSSGTDAILLALKAVGVEGLKVALPSHTFKATCGAVINAGGIPVIYDLDKAIYDLNSIAVHIPVHIAGEIKEIPDWGIPVIEDACQALGAVKNPTSKVQCWSFYPAKILGCKGDMGAITTNDEKIYNYIKEYRNHFKTDNSGFGGNHRADNLQCALLNIKIQHIDEILERRRKVACRYFEGLFDLNKHYLLKLPTPDYSVDRVWQDFIINVSDKRDELYNFLKEQGIETMKNEYPFSPEYPKPPLAKQYEAETLRLPCYENLTNEEQDYVIQKIKEFYGT